MQGICQQEGKGYLILKKVKVDRTPCSSMREGESVEKRSAGADSREKGRALIHVSNSQQW